MMKRIFGFWAGCCAAAGVLTSPDSGISIDAPNKTAQDRKPGVLRGGVAIKDGLSGNMELNMASLSLFMMRQWLLA
jgi:hypothetical protein